MGHRRLRARTFWVRSTLPQRFFPWETSCNPPPRRLAAGPARIVIDHPNYNAVVELTEEQRSELVGDLRD